jgi:CheY-like chemotaxis protein
MVHEPTMKAKLAILTVDDEKIILDSVRSQLERNFQNKYLLEFAESAEEAIEVTSSLIADGITMLLVISDYQMEGMKGDEFASWIKGKFPNIHVVIITGHMGQELSKKLLDADIVMKVIQKPWSEDELISLVDTLSSEFDA